MRSKSKISLPANGRLIPLAGPANRQGRIAADVIAGRDSRFRGTQGTSICLVFEAAVASTGVSEKVLVRLGDKDYEKIYLYPNSHAGYYPGAKMLAIKVLFRKSNGRLLGAQVLGEDWRYQADRFLCDGDPDGMYHLRSGRGRALLRAAVRKRQGPGQLRGDGRGGHPPRRHADRPLGFRREGIPPRCAQSSGACRGAVPGALNIPLPELRARLGELPRDREILVICRSAQRAYYATRILLQNGFKARNISGGMLSRSHLAVGWK